MTREQFEEAATFWAGLALHLFCEFWGPLFPAEAA